MNSIDSALAVTPETPAPVQQSKWTVSQVEALYNLPLIDLLYRAQQVHRENFDPNEIQRSALISIKTGGCSEDCSYCSQSARYKTDTDREALMQVEDVLAAAREAKEKGATRFCMGAAWRGPKEKQMEVVTQMIREVKALGMETCVTLGMLNEGQAEQLKEAGLDYYNHNLDTDAEFYDKVISTHTPADRVDTIAQVRAAGIKVCSGGILGMGESRRNRAAMVRTNSKVSSFSVSASGVPGIATRLLIGTESGAGLRLASCATMAARLRRDSPIPRMPPEQTLMPALRTCEMVSTRSAWVWVEITLS